MNQAIIRERIAARFMSSKENSFEKISKTEAFYDLRASRIHQVSHEDLIAMKYQYGLCKKYVLLRSQKKTASSEYVFARLRELENNEFPVVVDNGMKTLTFAAIALGYYTKSEYETAIRYIKRATDFCYKQSILYTKNFLFAVGDLLFNQIKCYVRWGKQKEAIEGCIGLLSFLLYGRHEEENISNIYKSLDQSRKLFVINFIFERFFVLIEQLARNTDDNPNVLYKEIFRSIRKKDDEQSLCESINHSLEAVNCFYDGQYEKFLVYLDANFDLIVDQPQGINGYLLTLVQPSAELIKVVN